MAAGRGRIPAVCEQPQCQWAQGFMVSERGAVHWQTIKNRRQGQTTWIHFSICGWKGRDGNGQTVEARLCLRQNSILIYYI